MEGSANNVLPFFVRRRGVFARRLCRADFGLCPDRSWTSSKPRPTDCLRTEAVNISLPPRGRWLAKRDGGIVKKQKGIAGQSLSRLTATAPFTQGSLFTFIYAFSIFLTSTAFVDTKAHIIFQTQEHFLIFHQAFVYKP